MALLSFQRGWGTRDDEDLQVQALGVTCAALCCRNNYAWSMLCRVARGPPGRPPTARAHPDPAAPAEL